MKRIFLLAITCVFLLSLSANAQQGKWIGTVKYKLTYDGAVSPQAPSEFEVKVYENKAKFTDMFASGATVIANAAAKTLTMMWDFSQVPVDGVNGKWYMREKVADSVIAKTTYTFTGNTKQLAGKNVKEVVSVSKNDDGTEEKETIWACDEIGPTMNLFFYTGLKAMPFEFKVEMKEAGITINFTASEVIDGKVKDTDLMLESDYEEQSQEEIEEIFNALIKAMGGGGEDDI
ncbi:MAG: hypothetical protein LBL74_02165 [Bacteroidales bacterium]|jgi:hypothetical protein|nr:hypothetical protein [Bacteroidales bacterium]